MRTVIYVGLIAIADGINPDWANSANIVHAAMLSVIFIGALVMDVIEFKHKIKKYPNDCK